MAKKIITGIAAALLVVMNVGGGTPARLDPGPGDGLSTSYITPVRVMWVSDTRAVINPEGLLEPFGGQVAVNRGNVCILDNRVFNIEGGSGDLRITNGPGESGRPDGRDGNRGVHHDHDGPGSPRAALLLDFGREYQGGIEIAAAIRDDQRPVRIRIRYGESVSEAMSDAGSGSTNEHAMRDFTLPVPWLGTVRTGESGFRFARIDLLDDDAVLPLEAVRLVFRYRDLPYLGSFTSGDGRLDSIWMTGAYTVHLNMQNYLWDGIKRDRLVWLGDMHPEVMCVNNVFGPHEVVRKSLDFGRDDTPLPGWMNGMCSYSLWWIIIHRDLYMYTGDADYLREQHDYLGALARQVIANLDGSRENFGGGTRFLDWPTSEMPGVIHAGLQSLAVMSLGAAAQMAGWLGDENLAGECEAAATRLRGYTPPHEGNKQAAALLALAGLLDPAEAAEVIVKDGAHGFSTFYGYYMLEALALAGRFDAALGLISDYWSAMLDLGATSFWEELDYADVVKASRIDEFVPPGAYDIHADGGAYCYRGLRHSLCHGWASGPTSWLTRHMLGVEILEPGMKTIRVSSPRGSLGDIRGTVPTPYGVVTIEHRGEPGGGWKTTVDAPPAVTVITD